MQSDRSALATFLEKRQKLIEELSIQKIDKIMFLKLNYDLIRTLQMKPYSVIDTIEKGIYNYQYFNILAKYYQIQASIAYKENKKRKYKEHINSRNNYYAKKDDTTLALLDLLNEDQLLCHFVVTPSKRLENKLLEIVVTHMQYVVLHTLSSRIIDVLQKRGIEIKVAQPSVIDHYVNSGYQ